MKNKKVEKELVYTNWLEVNSWGGGLSISIEQACKVSDKFIQIKDRLYKTSISSSDLYYFDDFEKGEQFFLAKLEYKERQIKLLKNKYSKIKEQWQKTEIEQQDIITN